jgi:hypothetical protein
MDGDKLDKKSKHSKQNNYIHEPANVIDKRQLIIPQRTQGEDHYWDTNNTTERDDQRNATKTETLDDLNA